MWDIYTVLNALFPDPDATHDRMKHWDTFVYLHVTHSSIRFHSNCNSVMMGLTTELIRTH